jgi:osomolarity two-component system phosphorelay intermediate protein YPD1
MAATVINMAVFQQILELDDDETHEYSRELVIAFFSQARSTFKDMDKALAKKDLPQLSSLGHFLKGSSAALGVSKVSSTCQKIEHYGKLRDEKTYRDLSKDEALSKIATLLRAIGSECSLAEQWLTRWYEDQAA